MFNVTSSLASLSLSPEASSSTAASSRTPIDSDLKTLFELSLQQLLKGRKFESEETRHEMIQNISHDLLSLQQKKFPQKPISWDNPKPFTPERSSRARHRPGSDRTAALLPQKLFPSTRAPIAPLEETTTLAAKAFYVKASITLPFHVLLTDKFITLLSPNKLGSGAEAVVYHSVVFPTRDFSYGNLTFSAGTTVSTAIKCYTIYDRTVLPEVRRLKTALDHGLELSAVDHLLLPLLTDQFGRQYSIHKKYTHNLLQTPFHNMPRPISHIVQVMIQVTFALSQLHENGYVHGDIKGPNLLALIIKNYMTGAVTDFGVVKSIHARKQPGGIQGTPEYWDPEIFGSTPKQSIQNQMLKKGLTTKSCDVHALGLAIYYDILEPFFRKMLMESSVTRPEVVSPLLDRLLPDVQLMKDNPAIHVDHPQAAPFPIYFRGNPDSEPQTVTHPSAEVVRDTLNTLSTMLLEASLCTAEDHAALTSIAELVELMRDKLPARRPSMSEVHQRFAELGLRLGVAEQEETLAEAPGTPPRDD